MIRHRPTHADRPPSLPPDAPEWSSEPMRKAMLAHQDRARRRMEFHDSLPKVVRDLNNVVGDPDGAAGLAEIGCRDEADARKALGWER